MDHRRGVADVPSTARESLDINTGVQGARLCSSLSFVALSQSPSKGTSSSAETSPRPSHSAAAFLREHVVQSGRQRGAYASRYTR